MRCSPVRPEEENAVGDGSNCSPKRIPGSVLAQAQCYGACGKPGVLGCRGMTRVEEVLL